MTALLYSRASSPNSQKPPMTIELPAAADHLANVWSAAVSATARASSASANMYPDVASSGSTITSAPASTARRIFVSINSVLAASSPIVGSIWQHAILTMVQRYGTARCRLWTVCPSDFGSLDIFTMVSRRAGAHGVTRGIARCHQDRNALHRLCSRRRTSWQGRPSRAVLVRRELSAVHACARVRRAKPWTVAVVEHRRRDSRDRVRHAVHGVSRHARPRARAAADDPVARPVRVPRCAAAVDRHVVHV